MQDHNIINKVDDVFCPSLIHHCCNPILEVQQICQAMGIDEVARALKQIQVWALLC